MADPKSYAFYGRSSRGLSLVAILCILIAVALHVLNQGVWHPSFSVTGPYSVAGRLAWNTAMKEPLPGFYIKGDTSTNPRKSDLMLSDELGALGPAHSSLTDVREIGGGRYLHWRDELFFSARRDVDPNVHPIALTAHGTAVPRAWLIGLGNCLAVFGFVWFAFRWGLFARLESIPGIMWGLKLIKVGLASVRTKRLQISAWSSAFLSALFLAIAVLGVVSRFDLIRVSEKIDFARVGAGPTTGYDYQVRRVPLYRPFVEVAPKETKTMVIAIDGRDYPCVDTAAMTSMLGQGRCYYDGGYILVSAPDNTNIAKDGRVYAEKFPVRLSMAIICTAFALALFFSLTARYARTMRHWIAFTGTGIAALGAFLIAVNIYGMSHSLRHPDLMDIGAAGGDVTLTYEEAQSRLIWRPDDTPLTFSSRATTTISQAMLHRFTGLDYYKIHVFMPIWENWILHLIGRTRPLAMEYRFWDPQKELLRGVGQCGDVSQMLASILTQHGIRALIVGLNGHVVVNAEVLPGVWYILDPDLGIVIPHDLKTLEQNAALVESYYRPVFSANEKRSNADVQRLVNLYVDAYTTPSDNIVAALNDRSDLARYEVWAYRLKWILPFVMLTLGASVMTASILGLKRSARLSLSTVAN